MCITYMSAKSRFCFLLLFISWLAICERARADIELSLTRENIASPPAGVSSVPIRRPRELAALSGRDVRALQFDCTCSAMQPEAASMLLFLPRLCLKWNAFSEFRSMGNLSSRGPYSRRRQITVIQFCYVRPGIRILGSLYSAFTSELLHAIKVGPRKET